MQVSTWVIDGVISVYSAMADEKGSDGSGLEVTKGFISAIDLAASFIARSPDAVSPEDQKDFELWLGGRQEHRALFLELLKLSYSARFIQEVDLAENSHLPGAAKENPTPNGEV